MAVPVSLEIIGEAARRIQGTVRRTPLLDVSERANFRLLLKCENFQVTGSFKIRGAYNLVAQLAAEFPASGVITYSSGNHAQAVAYAARRLGLSAVVVMPETAPVVKVDGARSYGAEVLFEGTTSDARRIRAEAEARSRGLHMVPPFDHQAIIAGQATVGLEVLEELPDVEAIYVPVGGGGLISGVAAAVKQRQPSVRVVGVEPVGSAAMHASLVRGEVVTLDQTQSVADGLLPVRPGELTFAHVSSLVDDIVVVDDEAIRAAVSWLAFSAKLVVEPSGAVSVAAALASRSSSSEESQIVAVLSGGNISSKSFASFLMNGPK